MYVYIPPDTTNILSINTAKQTWKSGASQFWARFAGVCAFVPTFLQLFSGHLALSVLLRLDLIACLVGFLLNFILTMFPNTKQKRIPGFRTCVPELALQSYSAVKEANDAELPGHAGETGS